MAVAIPMSLRNTLTAEELISLRQLQHYLGGFEAFFVLPESSALAQPGIGEKRFPNRFFGSVAANTRLMLHGDFYRAFAGYEYVLIYHLDALVFSDRLLEWCDRGFDYVAPPWLISGQSPWVREEGVGNGGFSLRRIDRFLELICSLRHRMDAAENLRFHRQGVSHLTRLFRIRKTLLRSAGVLHSSRWDLLLDYQWARHPLMNEDLFWGKLAPCYWPEFRVAPVEVALEFGFEVEPRRCRERNGGALPFGCHAWFKYDRAFWEPHLVQEATA